MFKIPACWDAEGKKIHYCALSFRSANESFSILCDKIGPKNAVKFSTRKPYQLVSLVVKSNVNKSFHCTTFLWEYCFLNIACYLLSIWSICVKNVILWVLKICSESSNSIYFKIPNELYFDLWWKREITLVWLYSIYRTSVKWFFVFWHSWLETT